MRTIDEALARDPEFVISAVSWPAMPVVVRDARRCRRQGPGGNAARPRDRGSAVAVARRRRFRARPGRRAVHAHAGTRLAACGRAGRDHRHGDVRGDSASTHLYHAVSLVRAFLGVDMDRVVVNARAFTAPFVDPLSFRGWVKDSDAGSQDHHDRHTRLRRWSDGSLRLRREPVVEPAARAPDRHPRVAR